MVPASQQMPICWIRAFSHSHLNPPPASSTHSGFMTSEPGGCRLHECCPVPRFYSAEVETNKRRAGWVLLALTAQSNPVMRGNGDQMETFVSSASQIFFWKSSESHVCLCSVSEHRNKKQNSDFQKKTIMKMNSKATNDLNMKHFSPNTTLSGLCYIFSGVCQGKCYYW